MNIVLPELKESIIQMRSSSIDQRKKLLLSIAMGVSLKTIEKVRLFYTRKIIVDL